MNQENTDNQCPVIKDTKEFDIKVTNAKGLVVVVFSAAWCGPCKAFAPIFNEVASQMPNIGFFKVDIESCDEVTNRCGVRSVPSVCIFKDGECKHSQVGAQGKEKLITLINNVFDECNKGVN